jgi:hypothetical protein
MRSQKKWLSKYEEKLAIDGAFGQVIRVAFGKKEQVMKELKKV